MSFWSVLKKDFKLLLRDRPQLAVLFLMPLAFILPISFAMGPDAYGSGEDARKRLPVIDLDGGARSEQLTSVLAESVKLEYEFSREEAESMVAKGWRGAALLIPAGFTEAIDAGEKVSISLIVDPTGESADRLAMQGVVEGAAMATSIESQLSGGLGQMNDMLVFAPEEIQETFADESEGTAGEGAEPASTEKGYAPIEIMHTRPTNYEPELLPDTYQQNVPGYTVMFVFFIIGYVSSSIKDEKRGGTLRRLLVSPASRASILAGKLAAGFIIGILQVAVMFAIGYFFFGMGLGKSLLTLLLFTMALSAAATSIGLAASTMTRLGGALTAPLIVGALLGGCIFPLDWMPDFLQTISYLLPHRWAMAGYQDLLVRGQGLAQVLPEMGILLAFTAVFFILAVRRFEFE